MRAYDLIYQKREGQALNAEEIDYLINGYVRGEIPDYQMSAWAMAVYFQGMEDRETSLLTRIMAESGDQVDLSALPGYKVDKHSTGGVGDKTTLVLIPLVAAAGLTAAKMSGRGLGHTGGTIDKLESIPGFQTEIPPDRLIQIVEQTGAAIVGQSGNLAPADKKLYALRDVTATVDSIPLIASSIMSKKMAGGAQGIVLDVKVGTGAFMQELTGARQLGRTMVNIGREIGRDVRALLTDMQQPLGRTVGNSLEVKEAIATLKGEGPADLRQLCLQLGAQMLVLSGRQDNPDQAYGELSEILDSGAALEKFRKIVDQQQGDVSFLDNPDRFSGAKHQLEVTSERTGYVKDIDARQVGLIAMNLGAGREKKGDEIDHQAGIVLNKKRGQHVESGETLAVLHTNNPKLAEKNRDSLSACFTIKANKAEEIPLVYEVIS